MVYCIQTAPTALTYLIEIVFGLCMAVAQDPARGYWRATCTGTKTQAPQSIAKYKQLR